MALISCAECNHQISDQASTFPNCGAPTENNSPSTKESDKVELQEGEIHCPFCQKGLSSEAISCGDCGAEYGYCHHRTGRVREKLYIKNISIAIAVSAVLLAILLPIGAADNFSSGWLGNLIFVIGLAGFILVCALPGELIMKFKGQKWWKQR